MLEQMRDVESDKAARATKTPTTGDAPESEASDVKEAANIHIDAIEKVSTSGEEKESTGQEETESEQKESVAKSTKQSNNKTAVGDKRRKCPFPGCNVQRGRLIHINKHLRGSWVPVWKGQAGNLEALMERQDEQFRL